HLTGSGSGHGFNQPAAENNHQQHSRYRKEGTAQFPDQITKNNQNTNLNTHKRLCSAGDFRTLRTVQHRSYGYGDRCLSARCYPPGVIMNYQISTDSAAEVQASCIVVTIDQSGKLSDSAAAIDSASQGYLQARFAAGDIQGKTAQTLLLPAVAGIRAERVLLVGTGKDALQAADAVKILNAIASATSSIKGSIALALETLTSDALSATWWAEQTAMAFGNALYRYTATKGKKDDADEARQPESLLWLGSYQSAALA